MKKHPKASAKKIEEYAKKKGIYIDVRPEAEHERIKKELARDLGISENLDMEKEEDRMIVLDSCSNIDSKTQLKYEEIINGKG